MKIPYIAPEPLSKEFIELTPDITAAILLTLMVGWQHAIAFPDVNAQSGEVVLTERLRDGMRSQLKSKGLPWAKTLMVLPGTESRSSTLVLIPDGRTDIPLILIEIFLRTQEHDPHAIIECKRIAGPDTHLCREYVVEGIDRFRTGKYGQNHAVGFMVGYLLTGDASKAVAGINAYLTRKSRNAEQLRSTNAAEGISNWVSQHLRTAPSAPINLYHSFFGFSVTAA